MIFANVSSYSSEGIEINVHRVNNIRYEDDTVLMTALDHNLQTLLVIMNENCEKMGMKTNTAKSKVMKINDEN